MTWLIIALAMLLVISPVVSALPSKKQRAIAALRQRALIKGFRVERIEDEERSYAGYRWHRERPAREPGFGHCLLPIDEPDLFSRLPSGVVRIELQPESTLVVWDEQGSEEDIDRMGELMQQLYRAHP